jgi:hypothetical protein
MVVSAIIQTSTNYKEKWNTILHVKFADIFVPLPLLFASFMTLLLGTVEWVGIRFVPNDSGSIFWQRPEWLYPVVCITIAVFFGTLALQLTKRIGAATLLGASILGLHYLTQAAAPPLIPDSAAWICLLVMFGVDLAAFISWRKSKNGAQWYLIAVVCTVMLAAGGLPIIAQTMIYPRINLSTIAGSVIVGLMMASCAAWAAQSLVNGVGYMLRSQENEVVAMSAAVPRFVPLGAAVVLAAFIVFFVVTATPPA